MKNKFLVLFISIFFFPLLSSATHIVGGSLTYEQLGGSTYRVTLKLYRDCKAGSAAFPGTVDITVTKANGTAYSTISIPFPGASLVPPNIDTCATNPGICLEEAIYSKVVSNLPPSAGGYHMYFQYCCRNSTLQNVVNPLNTGETWYAHIPDNGVVISNSSPKWVKPPPVFVCQGRNMSVNHSATDADGDSLYYSLYTPYNGDTGPGPLDPTYPGNVFTVPPITWSSTYGANNPLNAAVPNSLTINPSTGILTGVPPTIGQFVAGVSCKEYRNGKLIGEILRDFQFNVVNCPPVAVPNFTITGACKGKTVKFTNTTTPAANTYFWNFGDLGVSTDTSSATNPSYTYPTNGTYTVTLIINKGTPCADSIKKLVSPSFVKSAFTDDAPKCKGFAVTFTDGSTVDPGSTITNWDWNFGDSGNSALKNPTHIYNSGGTFTVRLITTSAVGCKDTITHTVTIQSMPVANAGNDTVSCTNNPSLGLGGTVLNATGGKWVGTGSFSPNTTTLNPSYTPTPTAVTNGKDTVYLITTGNGLCPADTDQVVITFTAGPTANTGSDIFVCKDTINVPVCASITLATGVTWKTKGTGTFLNPTQLCTKYKPSSADTTAGSVIVYVTTTGNGNCLPSYDSVKITFTARPTITITSNDSACAGGALPLKVTVSTGSGIWSGGTGTYSPNNTTLNGTYTPSPSEIAAGKARLVFASTNNGGCRSSYDTLNITIVPSPTAAFSITNACPGFPVLFTDGSTSVGSIVKWDWNFGDGSPDTTIKNPSHIYGTGGPYSVSLIVTSNNGCVDTLTKTINVFEKPIANFTPNSYCREDGTMFLDSSIVTGSTIISWNWDFGDSTTSVLQNPGHYYLLNKNYLVTLIVTSSQGCIDTVTKTINVLPGPKASFVADKYVAYINEKINFTDKSTGNTIVSWLWNFGDHSSDSIATTQNATHGFAKGGYFDVCLTITDQNGCKDTTCQTVIISVPPVVPSGFTPNHDGVNDIFYVYGGPFKSLDFKIYNNWGELIFESDKQSKGWDGTRNGVDQAIGVYVWTVIAVGEDNKDYKLSGDVTLLR